MIDEKEANKVAEDIAKDMFADWIGNLEDKEQPTCNIDNPEDCEACGS